MLITESLFFPWCMCTRQAQRDSLATCFCLPKRSTSASSPSPSFPFLHVYDIKLVSPWRFRMQMTKWLHRWICVRHVKCGEWKWSIQMRTKRSLAGKVSCGGTWTPRFESLARHGCSHFPGFILGINRRILSVIDNVSINNKAPMVTSSISRPNGVVSRRCS
jgi:hypothetical protein